MALPPAQHLFCISKTQALNWVIGVSILLTDRVRYVCQCWRDIRFIKRGRFADYGAS